MARNVWTNAGLDNNYDTPGNWSDAKPNAGDDVVVTGAPGHMTSGCGGESAIALNSWTIDRGSNVNIGSPGAYLDAMTPIFRHEGAGTVYYKHNNAGADDRVLVDSDNLSAALYLDIVATGLDHLVCLKGKTELVGAAAGGVSNLIVGYRTNPGSDVNLTIGAGVGAITTMSIQAGRVTNNCTTAIGTAVHISGGEYTHNAGNATKVIMTGGTFNFNSTTTLPIVYAVGGVVNMTGSKIAKTISALFLGPNATLIRDDYYDTVTAIYFVGAGGRVMK